MQFLRTADAVHYFNFVCEGCGAEGEMGVGTDLMCKQISCPEDCGASYVMWDNPTAGTPDLMCVVCPIFDEEEEGAVFAFQIPGGES